MLSILIPIYNEDVTKLVKQLYRQCCFIDELEFEIRIYDDHSDISFDRFNKELTLFHNVYYKRLPENIGRAKIRNLLAFEAKGSRLLFLDGDSGIVKHDFIVDYLRCSEDVVYGGRLYAKELLNKDCLMHWCYGHRVESKSLGDRLLNPYESFMSNNFMITKIIFYNNLFDESIKGYGYEDIEFAERLRNQSTLIHHINNPVAHLKLDDNISFLNKTINAVDNLKILIEQGKIKETKLSLFAKKYSLLLSFLPLKKIEPLLKKYLLNNGSNIKMLQLYKLILFTKKD